MKTIEKKMYRLELLSALESELDYKKVGITTDHYDWESHKNIEKEELTEDDTEMIAVIEGLKAELEKMA